MTQSKTQESISRVLLVILDGLGWNQKLDREEASEKGDAVQYAQTPNLDFLMKQELSGTLKASGSAVGLKEGEAGNSEVGHLTLGSGQKMKQGSHFIDEALEKRIPFQSSTWKKLITPAILSGESKLHFLTLLSDGNVHSHQKHLYRFLEQAVTEGVSSIRIHLIFDGRDVPFGTAESYLFDLKEHIATLSLFCPDIQIASGGGREVITMDRYERDWDQVRKGYEAHVLGEGTFYPTAEEALRQMRLKGIHNDQFLEPFVVSHKDEPVGPVQDGDSFVFLNFRGDRAIQFSQSFHADFQGFERKRVPKIQFAGLVQYDPDRNIPEQFLIDYQKPAKGLVETLVESKVPQWACSETHKFGHVTYFFGSLHSQPLNSKKQIWKKIESQPINTDDPLMQAKAITEATVKELCEGQSRFLIVNYPNPDMLGHTGNWDSTVKAVQSVDQQLEVLIKHCSETKTFLMVLSDHGNADQMFSFKGKEKQTHASHTNALVPFALWNPLGWDIELTTSKGEINQVAHTITDLLGISAPQHWEPSLIRFHQTEES